MKPPTTPPRKRSLFVRGYDRPLIEGRFVPRIPGKSNAGKVIGSFCLFMVASFALSFMAGYYSAKKDHSPVEASMETSEPAVAVKTSDHHGGVLIDERDTEKKSILRSTRKRLKIAVAVTVTRDGPYLDGAAVLQHSIRMTESIHDIDMVAIVHSEVQTTRPALKALGFNVIEFPPPILSQDIKGKHLRETIDKSGCCGALELLKLCAWKLEEYDWVVSMDMDAIWLQSLDHLFEKEIPNGGFMFTYDFAMDNPGSRAPPVQGGFLVIKPSIHVYEELISIVREGDFRQNTGWAGSRIGWCWGGQTVQGLLAYYAVLVKPRLAFPLDPCVYNSMATTKVCRRVDFNIVRSIHYTVCQKPWECHQGDNNLCARFLHAWWLVRNDLERANGLSPVGRCCGNRGSKYCQNRSYKSLEIARMKALPMSSASVVQERQGLIVDLPDDLPSRERNED